MARDLKNPLSPSTVPSFRTAFSSARKSGKKTFNWKNKNYTTATAEDKAKNMSLKKLEKVEAKAYKNTVAAGNRPNDDVTPRKSTDLQKSKEEQYQSYTKEIRKRTGI
jgi:hypothetical protein|tara:strand:+ start:186 stop:509 length:324 start_codon:yes stop_codon:yes gene_type:complete